MGSAKKRLRPYRARRSTDVSGEPYGSVHPSISKNPIFVVQKHAASNLHYDVRLEIDGVLVSWAVPKGPSVTPGIKRLAIKTDDHPLDYANFEGIIKEGYGAGTVMIWDRGTYRNIKEKDGKLLSMQDCLRTGRIEVFLEGKKLKGGYALVRSTGAVKGWLLIKMKDEYAHTWHCPAKNCNRSVMTGRTMARIAKEER